MLVLGILTAPFALCSERDSSLNMFCFGCVEFWAVNVVGGGLSLIPVLGSLFIWWVQDGRGKNQLLMIWPETW